MVSHGFCIVRDSDEQCSVVASQRRCDAHQFSCNTQQFSCWNRSDPNFKKLQAVDEHDLYFATALRLARRAVIGCLPDATGGATHYHAAGISPFWARGEKPLCVIGDHIFYKLI